MAALALAGVNFQSSTFAEALTAQFTDELGIYNDILVNIPDGLISPNSEGYYASFPHWNAATAVMTQITADGALAPTQLTQNLQRASWLEREIAFNSEQQIKITAAQDPNAEAGFQFGKIIVRSLQTSTINALTGVFATALLSTHVLDDNGNVISQEKLLAAKAKIGDAMRYLSVMLCNSKVYTDMVQKTILIQSGANVDAFTSGQVGFALGMAVKAEDALELAGGLYKSILAAPGCVGFKFRNRVQQTNSAAVLARVQTENGIIAEFETSRVHLTGGGTDIISARVSYLVHPFGMRFAETANPTDAALATGSNWTKAVTDDKLIKMVQYISA